LHADKLAEKPFGAAVCALYRVMGRAGFEPAKA
jgi:hypothetical protein